MSSQQQSAAETTESCQRAMRVGNARRKLIEAVLAKPRYKEDFFSMRATMMSEPLTLEQRSQLAATRLVLHFFMQSQLPCGDGDVALTSLVDEWNFKHEWAVVRLAAAAPQVAARAVQVLGGELFELNDHREDIEFALTVKPNAPFEQWLEDQPMLDSSSSNEESDFDDDDDDDEDDDDSIECETHSSSSKSQTITSNSPRAKSSAKRLQFGEPEVIDLDATPPRPSKRNKPLA